MLALLISITYIKMASCSEENMDIALKSTVICSALKSHKLSVVSSKNTLVFQNLWLERSHILTVEVAASIGTMLEVSDPARVCWSVADFIGDATRSSGRMCSDLLFQKYLCNALTVQN